MSDLRKDISDIISNAEHKILALVQDCIEKAAAYDEEKALYEGEKQLYREAKTDAEKSKEKYDKLFEGLRVEEKCGCTVTITSAKVFCSLCNGTGRVVRELTEDEKKEGR